MQSACLNLKVIAFNAHNQVNGTSTVLLMVIATGTEQFLILIIIPYLAETMQYLIQRINALRSPNLPLMYAI